tara:strand:- start:2637 stop:3101 length:465 start_codon:yes stop_codon:yes gene_type:complete
MDLVTGQRTYVLGVSGTLTANVPKIVEIPFTDTAGNIIDCNYCKLEVAGTANAAQAQSVVLELSGLSREGNMVLNAVSALQNDGALAGSGILGIGVIGKFSPATPAEWHGSNGQVANGAKLQILSEIAEYQLMITYGNLLPLNTIRLDQYDRGV